jgi:tetratricopeptide (TPR) repeat protein
MIVKGDDPGLTIPLARRAVELRPDFMSLQTLSLALGYGGQRQEALELARRAQSLAPTPRPQIDFAVAAALASLDRLPEAVAQLEPWLQPQVNDGTRHLALIPVVLLESLQGKRRAALRSFAEDVRIDPKVSRGSEAVFTGIGGDAAAVRRILLKLKKPGPADALAFLQSGLVEQSRALVEKLPADHPTRVTWEIQAEWKSGHAAAAATRFRELLDGSGSRNSHAAYVLGQMLADAGRCDEAIVEFDRLSKVYPWWGFPKPPWGVRMPLSLLEAARCHVKLGQHDLARQKLDRLLLLWKDADADLPALAEARALRKAI